MGYLDDMKGPKRNLGKQNITLTKGGNTNKVVTAL